MKISEAYLAHGADVLICSRTETELRDAASALIASFPLRRVAYHVVDLSVTSQASALVDHAMSRFGAIDIIVNNAGVHGSLGPLGDIDFEDWLMAIRVNLLAVAQICHKALPLWRKRRSGKIINLSGGGATAPQYGLSAYGASKAGLVRLTETLACENLGFGIDINAVAPGALATRLTEELANADPDLITPEAHGKVMSMRAAKGGDCGKAAELCVYLASAGSDGLTGRLLSAVWDPWPFTADRVKEIMASDLYTLRRIVPEDRGQKW